MPDTIAITGGTGFVGGHVVRSMVDAGYRVKMLARDPNKVGVVGDALEVVEGDLNDRNALSGLCAEASAVVHCAGLIAARDRSEFDAVNVEGTRQILEACVAEGVERLVFVSSLAAREPSLSDYGASKRAGETVVRGAPDSLAWSIVRPPAIYGPGDRGTLPLIQQLTRRIAVIPGSRSSRVSLIHVEDLATAIVAMLGAGAPSSDIHEVHDGAIGGYSWQELALAAGKVNGRRVDCLFIPQFVLTMIAGLAVLFSRFTGRVPAVSPGKVRELYHRDWVCRLKLLDEFTDWRPRISFPTGYAATVQWYRDHGWL